MIRTIIADDHLVVREGIRRILTTAEGFSILAEASSGQELLLALRQQSFDLLLLDLSLPDRVGLDLLNEIHLEFPDLNILIFSGHPEERYGIRSFRAGARGYLSKEAPAEEVLKAARKVSSRGKYISSRMGEVLEMEITRGPTASPFDSLSNREFEVFQMLAAGKSIGEIARDFRLSIKTVHGYRSRILIKLGMNSNADIIAYAFRHGLIR